jgi:predicted amidohydrolase YtcJ
MRICTRLFLILLPLLFLVSCERTDPATAVIFGGTIYTMNPQQPVVEAVAIRNNKIILAGPKGDVFRLMDDKTEMIDLKGKTVIPGFIEGHGHIMDVGINEMSLNLAGLASFEEVIQKVKDAVAKAEPGEWIVGKGWHQEKWASKPETMIQGFPVHQKLSEISPDNPVYLEHASGHAALANAKAMQMSGVLPISRETPSVQNVQGGEIIRDAHGNPTGLLNENALELVSTKIPRDYNRALGLALKACLRNGITSFHDAGATREHIRIFRQFKNEGKLIPGLYVMVTGFDRGLVYESFKKGPEIDSTGTLTIRSVKLNCDGALGSRGAWLLEEYSDQPGNYGMPTLPMDTVLKTARLALNAGFQVCSHAIGDRANREILDRYEMAFREHPDRASDHRFRIEHAQHLHPSDIPRFGKLGVIPAMQAIHMSSDRPWAIERLGEKRITEGAYMWQSLLKTGAKIVNGTDAPVEPLNPIACFYASVTRKTLAKEPPGGYEPNERMTREQALRSYTLDAAYGAFEEKIKGSIEVGKLANFTVLSKDIMTIAEDDILSANIEMTIVNGKVVYRKQQETTR